MCIRIDIYDDHLSLFTIFVDGCFVNMRFVRLNILIVLYSIRTTPFLKIYFFKLFRQIFIPYITVRHETRSFRFALYQQGMNI